MGDPESVGSDSLIMGKLYQRLVLFIKLIALGITYFWLDPKVPKAETCLPEAGL